MNQTRISTAVSVFVLLAGAAFAQGQETEKALDELATRYEEAWKNRDVKALAQIYTADATVMEIDGSVSTGAAEIEQALADTLAQFEGSEIQIERSSIRTVKPGVVVSDGTWKVTGAKPAEGETAGPTEGQYTVIAVQQNGEWRLAASQSRIPVATPTQ